ncbi:hypothetical protein KSP39_PZI012508 [Platanthera zijinensis]|uniref:Uncharacterized protein n=1 Tax=Platanthera zijinensis TaxID=2320716 RepID=A0AAP0BFS6_9ASPA
MIVVDDTNDVDNANDGSELVFTENLIVPLPKIVPAASSKGVVTKTSISVGTEVDRFIYNLEKRVVKETNIPLIIPEEVVEICYEEGDTEEHPPILAAEVPLLNSKARISSIDESLNEDLPSLPPIVSKIVTTSSAESSILKIIEALPWGDTAGLEEEKAHLSCFILFLKLREREESKGRKKKGKSAASGAAVVQITSRVQLCRGLIVAELSNSVLFAMVPKHPSRADTVATADVEEIPSTLVHKKRKYGEGPSAIRLEPNREMEEETSKMDEHLLNGIHLGITYRTSENDDNFEHRQRQTLPPFALAISGRFSGAFSRRRLEKNQMPGNKYLSCRCAVSTFMVNARPLLEIISEESKVILREANVLSLFSIPVLSQNIPLLYFLMKLYKRDKRCFLLGNHYLKLTVNEVAMILGLPNCGRDFPFSRLPCLELSHKDLINEMRLLVNEEWFVEHEHRRVWFFEHTNGQRVVNFLARPRICRWSDKMRYTAKFCLDLPSGLKKPKQLRYRFGSVESDEKRLLGPEEEESDFKDMKPTKSKGRGVCLDLP